MTISALQASLNISFGVGGGFILLAAGLCLIHCTIKRRKLIKKERETQRNANFGSVNERETATFTEEELKEATNNFSESQKIGTGAYGPVYVGKLECKTMVAIKKCEVYANISMDDVRALSQINHKNVVKLLGCCLKTEYPLLVYEYFFNIATLSEHIHRKGSSPFSWELRMKIAVQSATALAYLHSSTSKPKIIHRHLKGTNILLDGNYMVKLSGCGFSPVRILAQVTFGYLDPKSILTHQITEKSDVFSFGVVLVELLTSRSATSLHRYIEKSYLVWDFADAMDNGDLHQILDHKILGLQENIGMVERVAYLAYRCIRPEDNEFKRPSMKEVAMELEGLRIKGKD